MLDKLFSPIAILLAPLVKASADALPIPTLLTPALVRVVGGVPINKLLPAPPAAPIVDIVIVGFVTDAAVVITKEPVIIALPLTSDVPTTCSVLVGAVVLIPTPDLNIVFVMFVLPNVILLLPLPIAFEPITISFVEDTLPAFEKAPIKIDPVIPLI